ncbi:MAG TPA: PAS domain-containing protein, partial [Hyphomicrobium sp.]
MMIVVPIPDGSPLISHARSLTILIAGLLLTTAVMTYLDLSRRHSSKLDALRKNLSAATEYRGKLLHAVSIAAKELLTAASIEEGMTKVFEIVGETVRADRMLVLEIQYGEGTTPVSVLRYGWHSATAPAMPPHGQVEPSALETDPWFAPLCDGKAVTCVTSTMTDGMVKTLLQRLGIASSLDVPMIIEGKYWGRICFDDCTTAREWTLVEIDILRTLADLIGGAIIRERYIEKLKDANTIVERSPTILFRLRGDPSLPLIYVSHNVAMYGYDPAEMIASPKFYQTIIHPDDALRILELLTHVVMEGTEPSEFEFRMRTSDGTYR